MLMKNIRKAVWMMIFILAVVCVALAVCVRYRYSDFSLEDYSGYCFDSEITAFGFGENRRIESRPDAVNAARQLWRESGELSAEDTAHCDVFYDSVSDCWLVRGMSRYVRCSRFSPFYGVAGGVHCLILSSDGRVLGAWTDM